MYSVPDDRSRALALSTSLSHAGDWLNVFPFSIPRIDPSQPGFLLDYWLDLKSLSGRMNCAICNKPDAVDSLGDHQIGCGGNGDCIHRYDALPDALSSAAQSVALDSRKEIMALIVGSRSRPAHIFLPNWCGGRHATLNVTENFPLQSLTWPELPQ